MSNLLHEIDPLGSRPTTGSGWPGDKPMESRRDAGTARIEGKRHVALALRSNGRDKPGETGTETQMAPDLLTARERTILPLLAGGLAHKEIAHQLGLSTGTVKTYMCHFRAKTVGGKNACALIAHAFRQGWLR